MSIMFIRILIFFLIKGGGLIQKFENNKVLIILNTKTKEYLRMELIFSRSMLIIFFSHNNIKF